MSSPVILIIEDEKPQQRLYFFDIQDTPALATATILAAQTHAEARDLFTAYQQEMNIISIDGALAGTELDTVPLVQEFLAAGFTGTIIAASASESYREQLIDAGCNVNSGGKENVVSLLATKWAARHISPSQPSGNPAAKTGNDYNNNL